MRWWWWQWGTKSRGQVCDWPTNRSYFGQSAWHTLALNTFSPSGTLVSICKLTGRLWKMVEILNLLAFSLTNIDKLFRNPESWYRVAKCLISAPCSIATPPFIPHKYQVLQKNARKSAQSCALPKCRLLKSTVGRWPMINHDHPCQDPFCRRSFFHVKHRHFLWTGWKIPFHY